MQIRLCPTTVKSAILFFPTRISPCSICCPNGKYSPSTTAEIFLISGKRSVMTALALSSDANQYVPLYPLQFVPWQLYYVQICFSTFPQVVSTAHNPLWLYVRVYPVEYSATGLHLHQPHPDKYGITPPLCVPVHPLPHDKTSRRGWKYQLLPDTRPVFLHV